MKLSQVREFTKACHESLPVRPKLFSAEEKEFIRRMVNDELDELDEARDAVSQADALVDAIYYLCDSAARHGMNLDVLFEIVHNANMQKVVDGKVIRREDGKIMKPSTWQDPAVLLEKEMLRQTEAGAFEGN